MKHNVEKIREVYQRVCSSCGYENFIRTSNGARIERQGSGGTGFSHLNFSGDRIQFTEDHVGISVDQFAEKVTTSLREAVDVLRIPIFLVQQVTVRLTTTPHSQKSASEFLGNRVFRVEPDQLESFGRPGSIFGFRLLFPPTAGAPQYNVRIESYMRDPRALYIENVGTFKTPIPMGQIDTVAANIETTAEFLSSKVLPFVGQFESG